MYHRGDGNIATQKNKNGIPFTKNIYAWSHAYGTFDTWFISITRSVFLVYLTLLSNMYTKMSFVINTIACHDCCGDNHVRCTPFYRKVVQHFYLLKH